MGFVWFERLSPDPAAATTHVAAATGWRAGEAHADAGGYRLLHQGDAAVAGLLPADADAHWIAHVAVDDVPAVCRRAAFLQADVLAEPTETDGGVTAILEDPGGAVIAPCSGASRVGEHTPWALLLTARSDLAVRTYRTLLDWKDDARVATEAGPLTVLKARRERVAGVLETEGVGTQWVPCARVADVDARVGAAVDAGCTLLLPPTEVRRVGRLAVLIDPEGAPIGVLG